MISVILVQHNNASLTAQAIESLRASQKGQLEILLVDNASTGFNSAAFHKSFPGVVLIECRVNLGFGKANNVAARQAHGEILLFLNNDTICRADFAGYIEDRFRSDPVLGVLGPKLLNEDGTFQLSAGWLPSFWKEIGDKALSGLFRRRVAPATMMAERYFSQIREIGWVTGAALFIRKSAFEEVGGFDEAMFMYFEDKDICKRVHDAGMKVLFDPAFSITHLKGGSSPYELSVFLADAYRASQQRYYMKHRPDMERRLMTFYVRQIRRGRQ